MYQRPGPRRDDWLRLRYTVDGAEVGDIAAEAGVSPATIYRWLGLAQIRLRREQATVLCRDWLADQLATGATVTAIARHSNISRCTVLDHASRYGLLATTQDPRAVGAAARYQDGDALETIAGDLGVSRRQVTTWLRSMQVQIRRPGAQPRREPTGGNQ